MPGDKEEHRCPEHCRDHDDMARDMKEIKKDVGVIRTTTDKLEAVFLGTLNNGGKIGIVARVDKLEQAESDRKSDLTWLKRTVWGGLIGLIISLVIASIAVLK